jgi:hypothetical protein
MPASLLLQVRNVEPNTDNTVVDAHGHALPPCIVMERGEPLDVWAARAKPDRPQAFVVSIPLVTKLALTADQCTYFLSRCLVHAQLSWICGTRAYPSSCEGSSPGALPQISRSNLEVEVSPLHMCRLQYCVSAMHNA